MEQSAAYRVGATTPIVQGSMDADECRQNAARCMAEAQRLPDGTSKRVLIEIAAAWIRLAENVENNSKPTIQSAAVQPTEPVVMQQQQQPQPRRNSNSNNKPE